MGNTSGAPLASAQIELGDLLVAEVDIPQSICGGGPQGHGVPPEGLGEAEGLSLEVDLPAGLDPTDEVGGSVLDLWENLGKGALTGPIPVSGHSQVQGVVGPLEVVDAAPPVEALLALVVGLEIPSRDDLSLQRSMETLIG